MGVAGPSKRRTLLEYNDCIFASMNCGNNSLCLPFIMNLTEASSSDAAASGEKEVLLLRGFGCADY